MQYRPYLLREPLAIVPWVLSTTSISSLLLYLNGLIELRMAALCLLLPGLLLFAGFYLWLAGRGDTELRRRIVRGCWAGLLATVLYDLVRVPMVAKGVPVFKAISYFGTVLLGVPAPTIASEIIGWGYHLSNGIGFALMYVLWSPRPAWWSAVFWGLVLEGVMLMTPYVEVFGYRLSREFLAITIGSHVVYGLGLWVGMVFQGSAVKWKRTATICLTVLGPLLLAGVALHFNVKHGQRIPGSPPPYVGRHLYTTWDVLEPDRVAALWIWSRFVDRDSRFHFVPVFSQITHGTPFDVPEAGIRRKGTRAATEVLVDEHGLANDSRLAVLARVGHLYEITPWQLGEEPEPTRVGSVIKEMGADNADLGPAHSLELIFQWLDEWYKSPNPD